jgi:hypothetical protein
MSMTNLFYTGTSKFFDMQGMEKPEGWENQQD